jgi:hypothetical protein
MRGAALSDALADIDHLESVKSAFDAFVIIAFFVFNCLP